MKTLALEAAGLISTFIYGAAGDTATDPVSALLQWGPLGVVLALIVADKIGTHGERDRLRVQNAELLKEMSATKDNIIKEVVPLVTQNNSTLKEAVGHLARLRYEGNESRSPDGSV